MLSNLKSISCLIVITSSFIIGYQSYSKTEDGSTGMENKQNNSELNIGITAEDRKISADILNTLLADEFVVLVQTLNYHWNLVGPEFNDYHKLFNEQYHTIFEMIDKVAERTRSIGGLALGSMAAFRARANLKEDTGDIPTPGEMVRKVLSQHEIIISKIRIGINQTAENSRDMGTNNFLTDIMSKHEKMAWMLRSLTQK